jgi:hypothetical protein
LTEPDTSKINRLLSDSGIEIACAGAPPKPRRPRLIVATRAIDSRPLLAMWEM